MNILKPAGWPATAAQLRRQLETIEGELAQLDQERRSLLVAAELGDKIAQARVAELAAARAVKMPDIQRAREALEEAERHVQEETAAAAQVAEVARAETARREVRRLEEHRQKLISNHLQNMRVVERQAKEFAAAVRAAREGAAALVETVGTAEARRVLGWPALRERLTYGLLDILYVEMPEGVTRGPGGYWQVLPIEFNVRDPRCKLGGLGDDRKALTDLGLLSPAALPRSAA